MGYTLPVFACAAAIAAWHLLQDKELESDIEINLVKPAELVRIPLEQGAKIGQNKALAITRSDPGQHLDITRHTPVWAIVEKTTKKSQQSKIIIEGGAGIGIQIDNNQQAAIYSYARELITRNLEPLLGKEDRVVVTIILPEGKKLALKTSNSAFGVMEGLSLLGTTGIVQPLTAPSQLDSFQQELKLKAQKFESLAFCIGENGLDLGRSYGISAERLVKTANWLGSMLVMAGIEQLSSILLIGYHGKLIKLAGKIFHTHHHLADGRLEILTAYCARKGLPHVVLEQVFECDTTETALGLLRDLDSRDNTDWVEKVYSAIAESIVQNSQNYILKHSDREVTIGCILFDRQRKIIQQSKYATDLLSDLC